MLRFIRKLFVFFLLISLLGIIGSGAVLYWLVAVEPGTEIQPENIKKILGRESPVYYSDGTEKIGVLFQDAHRQYISYPQIPRAFVNAIVAAEDSRFFKHFGIDLPGVTRAMIANIRARRVVQGGSTITQQTAKNLFKRDSRTWRAKFKEMLYALRLEYHYPKEKILEFYVNQFFVSGNGHGLGVAARYYFDKDVQDLTLLESAFIAGSVKRPNYYNPFTKSTEEAAEKARQRARERALYVLGHMQRLEMITRAEYNEAVGSDIEFNWGRMSFALNSLMDHVRTEISSPKVVDALEKEGISNVSTSGVRIFTTVEKDIQDSTLYALRKELSGLDVHLRGYNRDAVQEEYAGLDYPGDSFLEPGAFLFGRIESIEKDLTGNPLVRVRFDTVREEGIIPRQGFDSLLTAFARFKKNRWSEADKNDLQELLGQLHAGDRIYVSVRRVEDNGDVILDLERYPDLQGGALVMRRGAVAAMAGGMENRFFNRAVDARRSMGSTFKPFLFAAAMQLGWNPTDLLNNRRDVFIFHDTPYFPRPDHESPHERVSMSWAGVTSENLAAVWLLYNLTEQLTPPRFRQVAEYLDLAPREGDRPESYEQFVRRIRDQYGIVVNREILEQAAYDRAVRNLETDFLFANRTAEYRRLRDLHYGLHFDRYAKDLRLSPEEKAELSQRESREIALRQEILRRNYLALQRLMENMKQFQLLLEIEGAPVRAVDPLAFLDSRSGNLQPGGVFWEDLAGRVNFSLLPPRNSGRILSSDEIRSRLASLEGPAAKKFWEDILLDGYLSVYAIQQVAAQMRRESEELSASPPYSMDVLSSVRDYRLTVALQYLIRMGRELGISSDLEPVLSFPLGSNVITLSDSVKMYEGLVTGFNFNSSGQADKDDERNGKGPAIIERIESEDGEVIYARQNGGRRLIDARTSAAVSNILQNTVQYGTGRYARDHVRLASADPLRNSLLAKLDLPVLLLGKTGTANQFRNAAFFGYVPVPPADESVMELEGGYTVGVYVGFDDNRPMQKGSIHVTGSFGALPTWSRIASAIINRDNIADRLDPADLSFNGLPLRYPETEHVFVPVAPDLGGIVIAGRGATRTRLAPGSPAVLSHGQIGSGGDFEPQRRFRPYWLNGEEP
ncbi:MAG TPA: glycosyl transferase family 51 [Desulfobacteraceae bacterium]|nr:glycosyl transferase family 51 [Desulfobacteraceae bacterium]